MKRRPDLPPRLRGRIARRLTAAAARGAFELPVCQDCKTVVFPVQEICEQCLSDRLHWQEVSPLGRVAASGLLHHSTDAYFTAVARRSPFPIGAVQLDAGPMVICRLHRDVAAVGAKVRLFNCLDRGGEQVFAAMPENAVMESEVINDPNREVRDKVVLVTGADGGIGRALVSAFVKAGARRVVAATRRPHQGGADAKVQYLTLDIADPASVAAAAKAVGAEVDILVNNAGVTATSGLLDADSIDGARQEIEVNYLGTLGVIRAFAPFMKDRKQGVIVNVLTVLAHACLPTMGSYCASKAAALSMTQGVRAELMPWGVRVCAIFPSTVDTPASADSAPPKLRPAEVAEAVVTMIRNGDEDHYPGRIASDLYAGWRDSHKVVERELGQVLPEAR